MQAAAATEPWMALRSHRTRSQGADMAELTDLESKLAEVLGLAMAAKDATDHVAGMLGDENGSLRGTLARMQCEAAESEDRCTELAGSFDGKKTAILDVARETRGEASEMLEAYLD